MKIFTSYKQYKSIEKEYISFKYNRRIFTLTSLFSGIITHVEVAPSDSVRWLCLCHLLRSHFQYVRWHRFRLLLIYYWFIGNSLRAQRSPLGYQIHYGSLSRIIGSCIRLRLVLLTFHLSYSCHIAHEEAFREYKAPACLWDHELWSMGKKWRQ